LLLFSRLPRESMEHASMDERRSSGEISSQVGNSALFIAFYAENPMIDN
jgi:hypothetical protein